MKNVCAEHDMNIADWFVDKAESGAKEKRPELDRLLSGEITNPPVEAVVVAKADRLARDINLYYAFKNMLNKLDLEIISVKEDWSNQDKLTAMILENFMSVTAEIERENIRIRTMGGRNQKAKNGGYSGGKPPYGYSVDKKRLVINQDEAQVVKFIFDNREKGATMLGLVDLLKEQNFKSRNGKDFALSTVQSILNNEKTYRGFYRYGKNDEWVQGMHDSILE